MAVIQKIRNKYAKLAGFAIALALVGFILMDAASGRLGELFGNDASVVKVNGEKIDARDYSQRVREYEALYNYSSQGRTLDEATRAQINDQALKELINEKLIAAECEKLGIQTTKEEEKDAIYGANPDQVIQQYKWFVNPDTKMFDPQRVKAFEQQIDQVDPTGKTKEEWEAIKSYVLRNRIVRKYNAMLTSFIYTPKYIMDRQIKEQNEQASIRYVKVPFATINDADVKVTDDELIAYMKKRASLYTIADPTRSIEYVSFDVIPSTEDTARALGTLNQMKAEFETSADAESIVNRNSDDPYKDAFTSKKTFMSMYADTILKQPVGTVYGPYFENGSYKMTKVLQKTSLPDSVKCRHILVKTENARQPLLDDTSAKKKLDSAIAAVKGGIEFGAVVQKFSDDEGSKTTGGEYTFTLQQRTEISKEFGDFIFDGKAGETKVVKVSNDGYAGYHYIQILEQKGFETAAKLATISKALYAGDATENAAYAKATEFAGKNGNEKAFDEAIKKENLSKKVGENVKVNDFMIGGLGSGREIIRWMYDANVGDVSQVFTLDGRYIVAKLSGKQDAGLMKLDAAMRPAIETAVKAEKKAEMIKNKYKGMSSLEAIAQAAGQQVQQADSFNASNSFAGNIGYEPKVVGYAFYPGFKANTVSPGIKGQDGVVYISLVNKWTRPATQDAYTVKQQQMMMEMQTKNSLSSLIQEQLRKNATIKYNSKNL
jgi:peptidyl-prolyl cis-trans isomerase D